MSTALSRPAAPSPASAAEASPTVALPSAARPTEPQVERVGADCYVVLDDSRPVGYIDVAGAVFVALWGRRYDRAVEVGQSLVLDTAAELVLREHHSHRRHGRTA